MKIEIIAAKIKDVLICLIYLLTSFCLSKVKSLSFYQLEYLDQYHTPNIYKQNY